VQARIAEALAAAPEAAEPPGGDAGAVLGRCLELLAAGEYARVIEQTEPVLRRHPGPSLAGPRAQLRALVWTATGLARRGLGDSSGARAAWDSALRFLPDDPGAAAVGAGEGAAALALGRRLLDVAAPGPEGDRPVAELRLACGLAGLAERAGPSGPARELGELTGAALASAFAARAQGLLHRREYAAAHRLLDEALAEPGLPPEGRATLAELYWTSVTGELGRLTGLALGGGSGEDALEPLDRAERLVKAVPPGRLSEERARDLARRLWWAYSRVGLARREAGDLDGAIGVLLEALRLAADDGERGEESRRAAVDAVDALVARWSQGIERLLADGEREAAAGELEGLTDAIDRALARGLSAEDLAGALARRRALAGQLAAAG
jgi:tetratricopeptide (TPR) repeat protein